MGALKTAVAAKMSAMMPTKAKKPDCGKRPAAMQPCSYGCARNNQNRHEPFAATPYQHEERSDKKPDARCGFNA